MVSETRSLFIILSGQSEEALLFSKGLFWQRSVRLSTKSHKTRFLFSGVSSGTKQAILQSRSAYLGQAKPRERTRTLVLLQKRELLLMLLNLYQFLT